MFSWRNEKMGLVIEISFSFDWSRTYFVQNINEEEAKEKAFKMFKQTMSCHLPDTLEEAVKDDRFFIEVITEVEQIVI